MISRFKKLFWLIKTIKNWPVWLGYHFNLVKRETTFYFRNGLKFLVTAGDFWSLMEIFRDKIYTKRAEILDDYIVIDIGASIGAFSIFAAIVAKNVKVYAYEPVPDGFSRLVKNIEVNNLKKFIKAFNLGVAGKRGKRQLFFCPNSTRSSFYQKNIPNVKKSIEIKVITLQDIFENNQIEKCDFLKMDCEEAEYEILFNTSPYYLSKIKNIALEYHYQGFQNLKEFLERNKFSVVCPKPSSHMGMLYAVRNNI